MVRPRVFMDFSVDDQPAGRVIFELYNDIVPKTCENFRALCTGERGVSPVSGRPLYYKNSLIHRSIANFMVQGGDFTKRNGTGGESIYGGPFPDENLSQPLDSEGLLCMANKGPDTNGSQFFITLRDCPHLNGRHVVFGRVIRGYDVVEKLAEVPAGEKDRPTVPIAIVNCGELELRKPPTAPAADRRGRSASVSSRERSRSRSRSRSPSRDRSEKRHKRRHRSRSRSRRRTSPSSDTDNSVDRKRRKRNHKHKHKRRKDRSRSHSPASDKVEGKDVPVADGAPRKETEEEYDARLEREEKERLEEARRRELERLSKLAQKESETKNGVRFKGRGRMKYVDPELHQGRWS